MTAPKGRGARTRTPSFAAPARRSVGASEILRALAKRYADAAGATRHLFLTGVKTGQTYGNPALRILDGLAIEKSWARPNLTGFEVKVSRGDFMRDDKWSDYLAYCHRFVFVCPTGLIKPDDLPAGVGLWWYDPDKRTLSVRKAALYRPIEVPAALLYYVLLSKVESDRHPFFSDRREFFEALVADRGERAHLGHNVAGVLGQRMTALERERDRLARELEEQKRLADLWRQAEPVLRAAGVPTPMRYASLRGEGEWVERLRAALAGGGGGADAADAAERIARDAQRLARLLRG